MAARKLKGQIMSSLCVVVHRPMLKSSHKTLNLGEEEYILTHLYIGIVVPGDEMDWTIGVL